VLLALGLWAVSSAAGQEPPLTALLDSYLKGDYDAAVAAAAARDLGPMRLRFVQDVPLWIGGDAPNAGRRGAAAAAFLLELTFARLETDWLRLADLIEAACVNLRRSGPPTTFELAWHRASVALAGRARARLWLLGEAATLPDQPVPQRPPSRKPDAPPAHLMHGLERFPDDPHLHLARIVAWTWGRDDELIRNVSDDSERAERRQRPKSSQQLAIGALRPLVDDPAVGDEAQLRTGQLQFAIGLYADALQSFERAGKQAGSPPVRYLASFLSGRVLEALQQPERAMRAYEDALAVQPDAESAAVALASLQFVRDDREHALTLMQRTFDRTATPTDPGRLVGYGSYMHWSELRAGLRAELQK
jgi:tetratricopeptide (TPR) repeat protein